MRSPRDIIFNLKIQSCHTSSKMHGVWVRFRNPELNRILPLSLQNVRKIRGSAYTCGCVSCGIRVILDITWKIATESRGNLICTWRTDAASRISADRSHSGRRDKCRDIYRSHSPECVIHIHINALFIKKSQVYVSMQNDVVVHIEF